MSIGNVPNVDLFAYMRDIANNEEEVDVVYQHISHGEIVNPQDLIDEVPDNLLDDDEYDARHAGDEEDEPDDDDDDDDDDDRDEEDSDSDDGNDGGDNAESDSEEAEIIETAEPMNLETENVEVIEPIVNEEPVEVADIEESVVEVPKAITVQYVRSRRSKPVIEPVIVEEPNVIEPELIDVVQIAQEVMAEAETIAQIVEEADASVTDPIPADIPTTSSQVAENIEQVLESSPKVVSNVDENENEKKIAELEEMVTKLVEANELLKASN
ncbi:hypothetical protein QVD17_24352 [Tagetes erecta]|uniref:Uncharacterized protein n=1 Tax=Tagetes erecta TaxID=13708 RepID=A0AAD8KFC0_TARER|nr:hypothetical protein QVD17_24352 [Tagetes erecta]